MSNEPSPPESPAGSRKAPREGPRQIWPAIRALLRTRIVTGLLTVIPIWVTWVVLKFVFDAMKSATEPIAWAIARRYQEGQSPLGNLTIDPNLEGQLLQRTVTQVLQNAVPEGLPEAREQILIDHIARKVSYAFKQLPDLPPDPASDVWMGWIVPIAAVLLTLFLLYTLGLLGASVFGRRLIYVIESMFEKVPLVKTIYRSTKQIVMTLGGNQTMKFQRVVLVEFPRPGMKCIAFLTSVMQDADTGRKMATVFISTTPNPTTGYMQIVPLEEVSETGWSVEEAVKVLMSGGILSPERIPFDNIRPVRLDRDEPLVVEEEPSPLSVPGETSA